jgi:diphosphomevalonate decarboxylase
VKARAVARANIAFAKYWGKADLELNLPAVPSLSMTLDRLVTNTDVRFDRKLEADRVSLDGREATMAERTRIVELLDRVRQTAGKQNLFAHVESENHFPTAAGLASSASGFAALAGAATVAAGMDYDPHLVSRMARRSSASAARSVWGGFVKLAAGTPGDDSLAAEPVKGAEHWDVRLVVALTAKGEKKVGSTMGMERSRKTSPLYDAWIEKAPGLAEEIERGLLARDLSVLGPAMEQSTMAFHACAMTSNPPIMYWHPTTLSVLESIRTLRDEGVEVYATMDAGPHVKALCHADDVDRVQKAMKGSERIMGTLVCKAGGDLAIEVDP